MRPLPLQNRRSEQFEKTHNATFRGKHYEKGVTIKKTVPFQAVTYQCPYCAYSCIQSSSIKSHLQHKHKDKEGVYRCKFCAYTSINQDFLEAHQKLHEASSGAEEQEGTSNEHDLHPMVRFAPKINQLEHYKHFRLTRRRKAAFYQPSRKLRRQWTKEELPYRQAWRCP